MFSTHSSLLKTIEQQCQRWLGALQDATFSKDEHTVHVASMLRVYIEWLLQQYQNPPVLPLEPIPPYPVGFVAELDDDQLSLGQQAVSQLLADRVGCLTGSEGTNLTSFVQTSLLTALLMGGYFPILLPLTAEVTIDAALTQLFDKGTNDIKATVACIRSLLTPETPIVILCDNFESYLLTTSSNQQDAFRQNVRQNIQDINTIHWIFVVSQEYVGNWRVFWNPVERFISATNYRLEFFITHIKAIEPNYLQGLLETYLPKQARFGKQVLRLFLNIDLRWLSWTLPELQREMKYLSMSELNFQEVFQKLLMAGLIRQLPLPPSVPASYTLSHPKLARMMQMDRHMLHRRKAQSVLAKGIERYQTDKQLLSVAERKVIEPHVDKLITTPQAQKLWRASQTTNWRTATILVATASLVMIGLALSGWWFWQRTQSQAITQVTPTPIFMATVSGSVPLSPTRSQDEFSEITEKLLLTATAQASNPFATPIPAAIKPMEFVNKIDVKIKTVSLPSNPRAATWQQQATGGQLWLAFQGSRSVQALEFPEQLLGAVLPISGQVRALTMVNRLIWVALYDQDIVVAIDPNTFSVRQSLVVGNNPDALLFDGEYVWVANRTGNSVQRINPTTGITSEAILVGNRPVALARTAGKIWVANLGDNSVQAIDQVTGRVIATVSVGSLPAALLPVGKELWVAVAKGNKIERIDPQSMKSIGQIDVGQYPISLAMYAGYVWVVNYESGTLQAIDLASHQIIGVFNVAAGPLQLVATPEQLWVINWLSNAVQSVQIISPPQN
jgi:YVTN family beta-propeller protein